jgi:hypothetical protein
MGTTAVAVKRGSRTSRTLRWRGLVLAAAILAAAILWWGAVSSSRPSPVTWAPPMVGPAGPVPTPIVPVSAFNGWSASVPSPQPAPLGS